MCKTSVLYIQVAYHHNMQIEVGSQCHIIDSGK